MILHCLSEQDSCELLVDGVSMKFSYAPNNMKVGTHAFHRLFESYENSWGTTVISLTPRTSAAKETFLNLLTPSHFL